MKTEIGWWAEFGDTEPPPRKPALALAPVRLDPKLGRNDPCPCGSCKKFKKCHGA